MSREIDCVLLAAGTSSRMSKWKLLLPFNGSTIIEHCIDSAQEVCKNIIVVTGYRSSELREHLSNRKNISFVHNPNYNKGMFSSVKVGVKAVKFDYFFISHADLPQIPSSVYKKLAVSLEEKAVFPTYNDRRGHPVLLPKTILNSVLQCDDNYSMKELLSTYPTQLVPVKTDSIYRDIDTDEDYKYLLNTIKFP